MKKALILLAILALVSQIAQYLLQRKRDAQKDRLKTLIEHTRRPQPASYFRDGDTPTAADVLKVYRQQGLESLARELEAACRPCIQLVAPDPLSPKRKTGRSRLGGLPDLPDPALWPKYKGKSLAFVAQVAMDELPRGAASKPLPDRGLLLVFYDAEQSVFGSKPGDRDGWRVLYLDALPDELPPIAFPVDLPQEARYGNVPLMPRESVSMPDPGAAIGHLTLTDAQRDLAFEIHGQYMDHAGSLHQLLGHASPIQDDDMQLDCQLASHGFDTENDKIRESPRAAKLKAGAANWMLLLQIDSDDGAEMTWGDGGRLYFWITRDDLEHRRFDKVWMAMQCY